MRRRAGHVLSRVDSQAGATMYDTDADIAAIVRAGCLGAYDGLNVVRNCWANAAIDCLVDSVGAIFPRP